MSNPTDWKSEDPTPSTSKDAGCGREAGVASGRSPKRYDQMTGVFPTSPANGGSSDTRMVPVRAPCSNRFKRPGGATSRWGSGKKRSQSEIHGEKTGGSTKRMIRRGWGTPLVHPWGPATRLCPRPGADRSSLRAGKSPRSAPIPPRGGPQRKQCADLGQRRRWGPQYEKDSPSDRRTAGPDGPQAATGRALRGTRTVTRITSGTPIRHGRPPSRHPRPRASEWISSKDPRPGV